MTTPTHSTLPWKEVDCPRYGDRNYIADAHGVSVVDVEDSCQKDIAFIVRACNEYEALCELEDSIRKIFKYPTDPACDVKLVDLEDDVNEALDSLAKLRAKQ